MSVQVSADGLSTRGHQIVWKPPFSMVTAIGRDVFINQWIAVTDTGRRDGIPAGF